MRYGTMSYLCFKTAPHTNYKWIICEFQNISFSEDLVNLNIPRNKTLKMNETSFKGKKQGNIPYSSLPNCVYSFSLKQISFLSYDDELNTPH